MFITVAGQANRSQVNMVSIEQFVLWTKCHLNKCAYAISQLNNVPIEHNLALFDNMGPNEFTPCYEQYNEWYHLARNWIAPWRERHIQIPIARITPFLGRNLPKCAYRSSSSLPSDELMIGTSISCKRRGGKGKEDPSIAMEISFDAPWHARMHVRGLPHIMSSSLGGGGVMDRDWFGRNRLPYYMKNQF